MADDGELVETRMRCKIFVVSLIQTVNYFIWIFLYESKELDIIYLR